MKSLKLLVAMLCMGCSLSAFAGNNDDNQYEFKRHWFIDVQGGVQHTLGEAKFGDLLSPNVQLGVGYQIAPWFGTRLAVNAWQSKGGWNGYEGINGPETVTYKYKYVAPGLDFMFNLTNAIGGFNPKRVVNVTAFVGAAANIGFDNDEAVELAGKGYELRYLWDDCKTRAVGRGGVAVDFRLCDLVSLGIEGNANVTSDRYNSKKAGNADWYFNVLAGLKFNLGKTYTKKEIPAPVPVVEQPAPAPVEKKEPVKPAPVVEKKVEQPVVVEPLRRDIFFNINKTAVVEAEDAKVAEIAQYLQKYPNAKVSVTGFADKGTGNAKINKRLSEERAAAVVKVLVEKYGIDSRRILSDSMGDTVQPFAENDMNRVTICVAE